MGPGLEMMSRVFAYGFRCFFLLGALSALVLIPIWLVILAPGSGQAPPLGGGTYWHAHEMIYGFTMAIVAGFLLTAVPNWTKTPQVKGIALASLAGLWLAGRIVTALSGQIALELVAAVDVAFVLALVMATAPPIVKARRWRNIGFPPLLLGMAGANLLFYLYLLEQVEFSAQTAMKFAVYGVILLIVVIGGRITPLFTRNALKRPIRGRNPFDSLAIVAVTFVMLVELVPGAWQLQGYSALVASVLVAVRMRGWLALASFRKPIVWILHVGYAWCAVGLFLAGIAALRPELVPPSAALHALTTGAIGTFTLAMMSRVALGHTGRKLVVHKAIVVAYLAMILAGVSRVVLPILSLELIDASINLSGILWSLAFLIYLAVYTPILVSPRADGKPG